MLFMIYYYFYCYTFNTLTENDTLNKYAFKGTRPLLNLKFAFGRRMSKLLETPYNLTETDKLLGPRPFKNFYPGSRLFRVQIKTTPSSK